MPMVKKVFAGLALGAALTSGALVLGVTTAGASMASDKDHERENSSDRSRENDNKNWWDDQNLWQRNENCWWGQNNWKFDKTDHSAFGIAAKDVAVGFQDKTDKDDWYNNQNWWNRNDHANNKDNKWWQKDDRATDNVQKDESDRHH
ncbi:hypothetical protein [Microbispora sp. NPDC049125]|uniref:hypothetical protein n=1 Tax=Microbispora sp. NPDC049125 TaxID=3154929 RepID=UPI003465CA14